MMSLKENLELDEKMGCKKHHVDIIGKNHKVNQSRFKTPLVTADAIVVLANVWFLHAWLLSKLGPCSSVYQQ